MELSPYTYNCGLAVLKGEVGTYYTRTGNIKIFFKPSFIVHEKFKQKYMVRTLNIMRQRRIEI